VAANGNVAVKAGYSTAQAAEASGLTFRQVDSYDRSWLVRPSLSGAHGSGTVRRYSYRDIAELCILARLGRSAGILERGARALRILRETLFEADYLVIRPDGSDVTATASDLLAVLGDQGGTVVVLGAVLAELDRALGLERAETTTV
jgi:DNA-binding transcriptional MerR regulator